MKRFGTNCFLLLILFSLIFSSSTFAANDKLSLVGEGILLMDYDTSRILYEENSNERLYPASTTKIMTAILAIELGNMQDIVEVDEEVVNLTKGSHIALDYNEQMKFEDLINALMVASANDAANAIAKHLTGSIDEFVALMNAKAIELGALDTNFMNPNGLHDDNHYTTASDLYLITRYAMENEIFREFASKSQYTIPATNKKEEARLLHTTNKFLYGKENMDLDGSIVPIQYQGIKGIKTGTTPEAKNCLISYAERDGKKIVSIVLKSEGKQVYADTVKLLDYGFDNFSTRSLGHSNQFIDNIDIENGSLPYASTVLKNDVNYLLRTDEVDRIEETLKFKDEMVPPFAKGDVLGVAEYYLDGNLIAKEDIVSTVDISFVPEKDKLQLLKDKWYLFLLIPLALIIISMMISASNKKKRRKRRNSRYS